MKIEYKNLKAFRNEEHFQFFSDFMVAVQKFNPNDLCISEEFTEFRKLFSNEDEAFRKVEKSSITEQIHAADFYRDRLFRGMMHIVQAGLFHFNQDIEQSAKKIQIVLDTYGGNKVPKKALNQETAAITNILQDLDGKYKTDTDKIKLTEWLVEIKIANKKVDDLMHGRYDEIALKTDFKMKECREIVDDFYLNNIEEKINAMWIINEKKSNSGVFTDFIKYFNAIIDNYNMVLAQRS